MFVGTIPLRQKSRKFNELSLSQIKIVQAVAEKGSLFRLNRYVSKLVNP